MKTTERKTPKAVLFYRKDNVCALIFLGEKLPPETAGICQDKSAASTEVSAER